jgi:hypothetical protein
MDRPTPAEITPAMIEAGEQVIIEQVGGCDLGGLFSAPDLARKVYEAMTDAFRSENHQ